MTKRLLARFGVIVFLIGMLFALFPTVSSAHTAVQQSNLPGGTWISPANGFSVLQNTSLKLSAKTNTTYSGEKIAFVQFTAYWNGLTTAQWPVIQKVYPTAGTNVFTYSWNMTYQGKSVPSGALEVSFDVYDTAGHVHYSPNGFHYGDLLYVLLPSTVHSPAWSGYVASSLPKYPISYKSVSAVWTINPITCGKLEVSKEAMWVGLGSHSLEQIGTVASCTLGQVSYHAQVLVFINNAVSVNENLAIPVSANDTIMAGVYYAGNGQYGFSIAETQHSQIANFPLPGSSTGDSLASAECILEAPAVDLGTPIPPQVLPLSNYGTETFSQCDANGQPLSLAPVIAEPIAVNAFGQPTSMIAPLNEASDQFALTWVRS